jgi:glyoxylase-like metal-dependent hydrolase (beta-lactamase superfamily II)
MIASVTLVSCSIQDFILKKAFVSGGEFTNPSSIPQSEFIQHDNHVYSFRFQFYRTLVVDTDEGLVVIDPMNKNLTTRLKTILDTKFPGKRVKYLIYSHYHLDHTTGGAVLQPQTVIAHKKCQSYWKDLDVSEVLPPTMTVSGDYKLKVGGVEIDFLDLGLSHTDTIFGFYLPKEKLIYTPDVGFVKSWPTPGPFNSYYPGYVKAMKRLSELDFKTFVPSHGILGTKQDFVDSLVFFLDLRNIMSNAMKKYDVQTSEGLEKVFDEVYPVYKKKYGHLHGFDQMAGLNLVRAMAGVNLGY